MSKLIELNVTSAIEFSKHLESDKVYLPAIEKVGTIVSVSAKKAIEQLDENDRLHLKIKYGDDENYVVVYDYEIYEGSYLPYTACLNS